MGNISNKQKVSDEYILENLSTEDKQKLVGAFVWLIEEDQKQNPEMYSSN